MRHRLLAFACLTIAFAGPAMADQPTSLLNKQELRTIQAQSVTAQPTMAQAVTTPIPNIVVTAPAWDTYGSRDYGPQYRSEVPVEIKSDTPDIMRSWDPNAHPGNANHMTPEGMACAADADCIEPLGCFKRADSGKVPEKLCAIPPGK
jgi:hypothetical protein